MTYVDEYRAALERQIDAIDATPRMPKPWRPCGTCGQDPRACACDGTPDEPGDGPDRAGWHYPTL